MGRTTNQQLSRPIFQTSTGQYPESVTVREGGLELHGTLSRTESRTRVLARKINDPDGVTCGYLHRDTRTYTTLST